MKTALGKMLIENGKISFEQLETALEIKFLNRDYLGRVLVNLGYIDEKTLRECLEKQGQSVKADKNEISGESGPLRKNLRDLFNNFIHKYVH